MSTTHIIDYCETLSKEFNVDLKQVIEDYNEHTGYGDYERLEARLNEGN